MKLSFEGIGQWAATFACSGVTEGDLVKISANGTVGACSAGDGFCGQAVSVARGGDACAVALGGMVTAGYFSDSDTTAPALGWCTLVSDGKGGVKTASTGHSYLVTEVNTVGKTVTFVL